MEKDEAQLSSIPPAKGTLSYNLLMDLAEYLYLPL